MREVRRDVIDAAGATSLVWVGDTLYDVATGWRSFPLDGTSGSFRCRGYGEQFDTATVSPNGDVVALIASTGTKALLLPSNGGGPIRELNRSYYRAEAFRYPLVLCTLPNGRTGLVHCPDHVNRLEIDDALTGERLTAGADRKPEYFFHSRLAVSPHGRYLLSAGDAGSWGCLAVYDLARTLTQPATLDSFGEVFDLRGLIQAEVAGACFVDEDIVISTSAEQNDPDGPDDLAPTMLVRWSPTTHSFVWRRQLDQTAGDLIPLGADVLALYDYPRLYEGATGNLMGEWPELATGHADSAFVWKKSFSGPARVAVDQTGRRFAVTDRDRITVIHLG